MAKWEQYLRAQEREENRPAKLPKRVKQAYKNKQAGKKRKASQ